MIKKIILTVGMLAFANASSINGGIIKNDFSMSNIKYWNFSKFKNIKNNEEMIKNRITKDKDTQFVILDNLKLNDNISYVKGFYKDRCIIKETNNKVCVLVSPSIDNSFKMKTYKNAGLKKEFTSQPLFIKLNEEKGLLLATFNNKDEFAMVNDLISYFSKISQTDNSNIVGIFESNISLTKKENSIFSNQNDGNYIDNEYTIKSKQKVYLNKGSQSAENIPANNKEKSVKEALKEYKDEASSYFPININL